LNTRLTERLVKAVDIDDRARARKPERHEGQQALATGEDHGLGGIIAGCQECNELIKRTGRDIVERDRLQGTCSLEVRLAQRSCTRSVTV
jgi:hypothetical protein